MMHLKSFNFQASLIFKISGEQNIKHVYFFKVHPIFPWFLHFVYFDYSYLILYPAAFANDAKNKVLKLSFRIF